MKTIRIRLPRNPWVFASLALAAASNADSSASERLLAYLDGKRIAVKIPGGKVRRPVKLVEERRPARAEEEAMKSRKPLVFWVVVCRDGKPHQYPEPTREGARSIVATMKVDGDYCRPHRVVKLVEERRPARAKE